MLEDISVNELSRLDNAVYIDVRSQQEYSEGTIPGAVNVPLFDDQERAKIGTIYTRESPKKAMDLGLQIASNKLPSLYKQVEHLAGKGSVMLFCWRGGMRSKSLATILDLMGMPVYRLNGGYKAYRRFIVDFFAAEFPFHIVVLRGNTGAGKTEILKRLKVDGYPVIDLEGLSNNRGSVFGSIGLGNQPTQKQFEAMLFEEIKRYSDHTYLIVECESKRIGRITVPDSIFSAMQEGTQVLIFDTLKNRAQRLVHEYTEISSEFDEDLTFALERLKKRLGNTSLSELLEMLQNKAYKDFATKIIIEYYDKLYGYPNEYNSDYELCIDNRRIEEGIMQFKYFLNNRFFLT